MDHSETDHSETDHSAMDHSQMEHGAHGGHADHVAQFRTLFAVMLVIAVPVVAADAMFADLVGYTLPENSLVEWISPVLGTVMYLWGGKPFLTGAVAEIRSRQPGMMLLIALAITVAFFASWAASLHWVDHTLDFWWELALLIVIMLLGHWIEMRSLSQTSSALDSLAALLPDEAERVVGESVETVPTAALATGDLVIVRPGARVPSDGTVVEGSADMDESMITGESKTVRRTVGDQVVAGTVATDSALRLRVTAVGEDTALAGIRRLVEQAQNSSSRAQVLADKAAALLFWYALGAAVLTAIAWSIWGTPESAVTRTITVLVIACPHALGLAIPLVVSIATERAARAGILITDRMALEAMRNVDTVLFDKTGTLTKGEPAVVGVRGVDGYSDDEVLSAAAAVEFDSEHPLGRAVVAAARELSLEFTSGSDFQAHNGIGVAADVGGARVGVGGPGMLRSVGATAIPGTEEWLSDGSTVLHVVRDEKVIGALALADEIRPESALAVDALHARGVRVAMVTGDAEAVAYSVARRLGIDEVFAEVLPQDKGAQVSRLQAAGHRVAMVGDGVNDAPALAQADVGIAIGAGTDVAIASAGVVLASDDPRSVSSVIELSRATYRKMVQNLWWAAGYNAISVPLAAGVLAPVGFVLPMEVGAILMSVSTVVVAANAQLLRRLDLRQPPVTAFESRVLTPQ
ncbi:heavy metal translocating P-type ATPase [Rhodococcus erythropolis]|uniref:heavy metal translocating P-type ATPase n=1 Tax=Rhodococcus erythropolis TaxID=1833 RepID=UPI000767833C|nr:heavy metal translocating P-type ATPase [Rhodococcus erythropolis]MDO1490309.1 heavy metal translocating P-type ATPase [Rhodococcus erythropolis]